MQPRLCAWAWARIPPEAPTGVLNAAAVFKLPGGSIRGDRDRILPDRLRYRIRDHRNGSRHRPHAQHQIHGGEFVAEIAPGQRQDATQELLATWGPQIIAYSQPCPWRVLAAVLSVTSMALTLMFGKWRSTSGEGGDLSGLDFNDCDGGGCVD